MSARPSPSKSFWIGSKPTPPKGVVWVTPSLERRMNQNDASAPELVVR